MFHTRITARIATVTLAAALALGGLFGVGLAQLDDGPAATPTEEAGATWSFTVASGGGKGGAGTQGATWS